jgi:hypothetical protein
MSLEVYFEEAPRQPLDVAASFASSPGSPRGDKNFCSVSWGGDTSHRPAPGSAIELSELGGRKG